MMTVSGFVSIANNEAARRSSGPGRAGRMLLPVVGLLLFVLGFLGTVLLLFPAEQFRDHVVRLIERQTGLQIAINEISISPLFRLEARGISWQSPKKEVPPLVVDRLSVAPLWTSLPGQNPGGRFHAAVAEGTVDGRCGKDGSCNAVLSGVQLDFLAASSFFFQPSGTINGTIVAEGRSGAEKGRVGFDLVVEEMKVAGLAEHELLLGNLHLRGKVIGQTLALEDLGNEGGDLTISGKGTVLMGNGLERSPLSLQLSLKPEAGLPPIFRQLFLIAGLKAAPGGDYSLRLTGTLAKPVIR